MLSRLVLSSCLIVDQISTIVEMTVEMDSCDR